MQKAEKLDRSKILIIVAISSVLLMAVAKIWQMLAHITLAPIQWKTGDIVLSVSIVLALAGVSNLFYRFWPLYHQSVDAYLEPIVDSLDWWDLIWLGLLPGMSEELLFRGVMLPAFGFDLVAVLWSSFIFGILHLPGLQYWPYCLMATSISIVLCYTLLVSGNLLVPILIHVLLNLFSGIFWKFNRTKTT